MSRYLLGQSGIVKNVVESTATFTQDGFDVLLDPTGATNVGDAYDPKDIQLDAIATVIFQLLFRHENELRELIRTVRTNATLNTQATTAGLPTTANSADVTLAQFKSYVKTLF